MAKSVGTDWQGLIYLTYLQRDVKNWVNKITHTYPAPAKKTKTQLKNGENMNRQFTKKDVKMIFKHMENV